jgi:hypothetical protein
MFKKSKIKSPDKIKISTELLMDTVALLEELDSECYTPDILKLYGYVLFSIKEKMTCLEFHDDYQNCYEFLCCEDDLPF